MGEKAGTGELAADILDDGQINNTDGRVDHGRVDRTKTQHSQITLTSPDQVECLLAIDTRCRLDSESGSFDETKRNRGSAFQRFLSDKKLRADMSVPGIDERVAGPYVSK